MINFKGLFRAGPASYFTLGVVLILLAGQVQAAGLSTRLNDVKGFFKAVWAPERYYRVPPNETVIKRLNRSSKPNHSAPAPSLSQKIEVLVWNVQKCSNPETLSHLKESPELKADLTLLQEYRNLEAWTSSLLESLPGSEWWMASQFSDDAGADFGVLTGSRVQALKAQARPSTAREPISKTPKMAFFTEYPLEEVSTQTLGVLNVHAINFVRQVHFESHVAEMVALIRDHKGPLLVAGDFNTWSDGRFTVLQEAMTAQGLQYVDLDPKAKNPGFDHIFVRNLEVKHVKVLTDVRTSDHFPIKASIQLASP